MRAQRREGTHFTLAVSVHGHGLARSAVEHASGAWGEVFDVGDVALQEALVLGVDLDRVGDHGREAGCHAEEPFGRVDGAPGRGGFGDEVGDEFAPEGVVDEAVAHIAG